VRIATILRHADATRQRAILLVASATERVMRSREQAERTTRLLAKRRPKAEATNAAR
jgi:hypothetical protein